ncbi:restriction endonuclease subunit S [Candidatus Saccharibacteria bacterium]|nr:restriction endonuclease subunit S [Candidatus Saccharibacteria bacterium]MBH1973268.1 restriction endonuclease subunit S [Candidatus Saccharibacteria bacterium]MBH1990491.1 restriction endonuclease subunit S [Candidatus Saccharibacteria bacterium]
MINWQTKKLSELGAFSKGAGIPKDSVLPEGLPAVRYGELYTAFDTFIKNVRSYIDEGTAKESREIRRGDILFAGSGETIDEIGKSAVYQHSDFGYAGGDIITLSPDETNSSSFLAYALNSPTARKDLRRLGQGQSVVHVYRKDLEEMSLLLPEKQEQWRIVAVLEVWDEYLELLDRKIALKEQLKKGLMQQLLTGKKRLPGFTEEWRNVKLSEIGDARTSSVDKLSIDGESPVRLLNYMDVYRRSHVSNSDHFQAVTAKDSQIYSSNLKKGDILFTPSSETPTDIGHSAVVTEDLNKVLYSYHLMRLRPKSQYLDYRYSAYCFKANSFYRELWKRAQGATRYTLSKEALESSKVSLPIDIDEQIAVSSVLKEADKQLTTLIQKQNHVKLQKKFLLKNLISSTIRTPENLHIKGAN